MIRLIFSPLWPRSRLYLSYAALVPITSSCGVFFIAPADTFLRCCLFFTSLILLALFLLHYYFSPVLTLLLPLCPWLFHDSSPAMVKCLPEIKEESKEHFTICLWLMQCKMFQGSSNIDEEFILKQFEIDYQSKPSCDVLHTMGLSQVPLELKKSVGLNSLQEPECFQKLDHERKHQKLQVIAKGEKTENQRKFSCIKILNVLEFWHQPFSVEFLNFFDV